MSTNDPILSSRNGEYHVDWTDWNHNGTLYVTVSTLPTGELLTPQRVRAMRRLARRAISMPEKTRSSRTVCWWYDQDGTAHVEFAVSRLPR